MTNAASAMARLHDRAPVAWPSVPGRLPLTEEAVRRTAGTSDPAVRNLWITQSYADLARRFLDVLATDQTWCTFAIWTSITAGRSIRARQLSHLVDELLPGAEAHLAAAVEQANSATALWRRLGLVGVVQPSHLEHCVETALRRLSAVVSDANGLVFAELAPLFLHVVEALEDGDLPDADRVDGWLDRLGVPHADAEPLVRLAFVHYALATCTTTDRGRAQHVLAANIAIALHEQQRLQAGIETVLDAGLIDVGDDLCGAIRGWVPASIRRRMSAVAGRRMAPHVERLWQHMTSGLLMRLSLRAGTLHLDRDVPPPTDAPMFPDALADIDLRALSDLMTEYDPTGGTGTGSRALDWADIDERMGYLVNLFRSRQRDLDLTMPPFSTAELAWMVRGEVPPTR